MSDGGQLGRLKRSRDEMVDAPSGVKPRSKSPSSNQRDNAKVDRDSNSSFARAGQQPRSAFNPVRPTSPLKLRGPSGSRIVVSGAPSTGHSAAVPPDKMDVDQVASGRDGGEQRKPPPTGKFSIRGNVVEASGGGRGVGRKGAATSSTGSSSNTNGTIAAFGATSSNNNNNNADSTKKGSMPSSASDKDKVRVGNTTNASGVSAQSGTGVGVAGQNTREQQDLGEKAGKAKIPLAQIAATAAAGSSTGKANGKGKRKAPTPPPGEPKTPAVVHHENGGATGIGSSKSGGRAGTTLQQGELSKNARQQQLNKTSVSSSMVKVPVQVLSATTTESKSDSNSSGSKITGSNRRTPPILPLDLKIPSNGETITSSSPSPSSIDSTDISKSQLLGSDKDSGGGGITDDSSSTSNSGKAKRRRRANRAPTPPSGWQAPTIGDGDQQQRKLQVSEISETSRTLAPPPTPTALRPTAATAAAGLAAAAASADPGALGRRSRRPGGGSSGTGTPLAIPSANNGRHVGSEVASTTAGGGGAGRAGAGGGGSSGGGASGPVKKRSRLSIKEEGRGLSGGARSAGAGAAGASGPGGGKVGADKSTGRGRGRPPSRGRGAKGRGRRRLLDGGNPRGPSNKVNDTQRWRTHRMVEDYVNTCGSIMYPRISVGPFGYKPCDGRFPMERPTTLGMLRTQMRRPTVIEKWSPYQVALFEGAISIHGKVFHKVAAVVDGKTVPDVIEFYYMWKKTNHYKQWKATWRAEQAMLQPSESESEGEDDDGDESYEQNTGGSSASSVVDVERAEVGAVGNARGRKNGGGAGGSGVGGGRSSS